MILPSPTPPALLPPATATQQELFGTAGDAAASAFALDQALAACTVAEPVWMWVQDRQAIARAGRPFLHGLPPRLRRGLIHVSAAKPEDALFAIEEGLRCRDFVFVLGEITGDPRALDFTASRRLSLASERHGVALHLVRIDGFANLSAARRRWRIAGAPSLAPRWNPAAPGMPRWQAELFRARDLPPGQWIGNSHDGWSKPAPDPVDLAAAAGDRALATPRRAA